MPVKNYHPKPSVAGNVSAVRMTAFSNAAGLIRLLSMCSSPYSVTFTGDDFTCCVLRRNGSQPQTVLWSDYVILDESGEKLSVMGAKEFLATFEENKEIRIPL